MTTSKRVFILRLEGEVFDKIGLKAMESHRSKTNYIEFVLLKNLERYREGAKPGQNRKRFPSMRTTLCLKQIR